MIRSAARAARVVLWCAALAALGGTERLAAQQGCSFVEGSGNLSTVDFGGSPVTYVSTPNLVCRDGVRIRADSAIAYQASSYVELIGRVRFDDAIRRLTANRAEYFTTVGRLQAHGSVQVEQKDDGGVIRGEEMIYLRAGPDRARDQLDVFGGRSNARLFVRRAAPDTLAVDPLASDSEPVADTSAIPYEVDADRILVEGDSYFRAMGDVEIERDGMQAFGDSVEYDQVGGTLRMANRARMIMDGRELTAEVIQARIPGEVVSEVIARERAVLTADDVRLEAPLVHVFFADGAMERLVAIPIPIPRAEPGELPPPAPDPADLARPVARADRFSIVADSLDVLTPAEALERIHATGDARAESTARDSLNAPDTPAMARTDWMEGDTIVATFVRDSASAAAESDYRLERLVATASARSLYRMTPEDTTRACRDHPVIHYVVAQQITIEMERGEIQSMDVTGQADGVHAEPAACAPADSAAADSAAAVSDSAGGPGGVGAGRPVPDGPFLPAAGAARQELGLRRRMGGRR